MSQPSSAPVKAAAPAPGARVPDSPSTEVEGLIDPPPPPTFSEGLTDSDGEIGFPTKGFLSMFL
jgi:hypothetical protein